MFVQDIMDPNLYIYKDISSQGACQVSYFTGRYRDSWGTIQRQLGVSEKHKHKESVFIGKILQRVFSEGIDQC